MKYLIVLLIISFSLHSCGDPIIGSNKTKAGHIQYIDTNDIVLQRELQRIGKTKVEINASKKYKYLVNVPSIGLIIPPKDNDSINYPPNTQIWVSYIETDFKVAAIDTLQLFGHKFPVKKFDIKIQAIDASIKSPQSYILSWIQMGITIGACAIILLIWFTFHYRRNRTTLLQIENESKKIERLNVINVQPLYKELLNDIGVLFLVLALFFWAVTGIININAEQSSVAAKVFLRVFSLANNSLFLLSFPYFRHGIPHFTTFRWYYVLIATFLIGFSFYIFYVLGIGNDIDQFKWFDICYSSIIISVLGGILSFSFWKRKLEGVALLAILITIGVSYSQISPFFPIVLSINTLFHTIFYYVTFILFLILLISVTFTWYQEEMLQEIEQRTTDELIPIIKTVNNNKLSNPKKRELLKEVGKDNIPAVLAALSSLQLDQKKEGILFQLRGLFSDLRYKDISGVLSHWEVSNGMNNIRAKLIEFIQDLFPDEPLK